MPEFQILEEYEVSVRRDSDRDIVTVTHKGKSKEISFIGDMTFDHVVELLHGKPCLTYIVREMGPRRGYHLDI